MIDDVWKAAQDIHTNVGGINETQQQMKGNILSWEKSYLKLFFKVH